MHPPRVTGTGMRGYGYGLGFDDLWTRDPYTRYPSLIYPVHVHIVLTDHHRCCRNL